MPWTAIIGFALLMLLGLGIPFWMEYKSLTNPPYVSRKAAEGRTAIDPVKSYYCPNCGERLTLPAWSDLPPRPGNRVSAHSLNSSTTSFWETTSAPRPRASISGEAP